MDLGWARVRPSVPVQPQSPIWIEMDEWMMDGWHAHSTPHFRIIYKVSLGSIAGNTPLHEGGVEGSNSPTSFVQPYKCFFLVLCI
jgi:hypothetical protein